MERIHGLFMWLIVIGPIHIAEQLFTSIEEFHMLRDQLGGYYALFSPSFADSASVILITMVFTLVSLMLYGMLVGGRGRTIVLSMFGLLGVGEIHHAIAAVSERSYDPGLATCFAYVVIGGLLLRELWRGSAATVLAAGVLKSAISSRLSSALH